MSRPATPPPAPWPPPAALWSTLFLGPLAGALVTAANLRRLGRNDKAIFALAAGIGALIALGTLWAFNLVAGERGLLTYLVLSVGNSGLFFYLQQADYRLWVRAHPRDDPAPPATAVPWALIGFALTLALLLVWLTAVALTLVAGGEL
jgi:hypothetical protein